jgi:hypothetical protein
MAKKKTQAKKKKAPKRPPQKAAGAGVMMPKAVANLSHAMGVCSVTNPFCPEARGARWPDNSFTRSKGLGMRGVIEMNCNANGYNAFLIIPRSGYMYALPSATMTTGTASFGLLGLLPGAAGNWPPGVCARYRIISCGIALKCTANPLDVAGMCHVRTYSPMNGISGGMASLDITSNYSDDRYDVPLARLVDETLYINLMPLGTEARLFRAPEDPTETAADFLSGAGFQSVVVGIKGPNNLAGAIVCDWYFNYEIVYTDAANQIFMEPPAKYNPKVMHHNAQVLETVPSMQLSKSAKSVDQSFLSRAMSIAGKGIEDMALSAIAGFF